MLTRPSHMVSGFDPDSIKGKAALVGQCQLCSTLICSSNFSDMTRPCACSSYAPCKNQAHVLFAISLQSHSPHAGAAALRWQAYAPQYPVPKEERWFFVLADPATVSGSLP